jgi:hypothetical protein
VIEIVGQSGMDVGESHRRGATRSRRPRWPAIQAFPPQTPGVLVIRSWDVDVTPV